MGAAREPTQFAVRAVEVDAVFAGGEAGRRCVEEDVARIRSRPDAMPLEEQDLTVVDPGEDAYGFQLDVCVQSGAGLLSCASERVFE